MAHSRVHAVVRGHVQGVFFRSETRRRALSLGLTGWVRNRGDGAVEAVFEGPQERVESMLGWCERGPAGAEVESVSAEWQPVRGESGFDIL